VKSGGKNTAMNADSSPGMEPARLGFGFDRAGGTPFQASALSFKNLVEARWKDLAALPKIKKYKRPI
jgi:hypothetical protein